MFYRLIIILVTVAFALLSAPVMGGNTEEESVIVDPKTGEIIAIHTKNSVSGQQAIKRAKKHCLDNQTVQEVRVDGTVICHDTATGSITSYLDIDEVKSTQSVTSLKTFETSKNISPCPKGSALVKLETNGRIECEPL